MVAIKRAMEPEIKQEAEERKLSTLKQFSKDAEVENFHYGKTRDILGSFVGVSGKTLRKAEAIVKAA